MEVVEDGVVDAVCVGCGSGVGGLGAKVVTAGPELPFHRRCFKCAACQTLLPLIPNNFHVAPMTKRLLCIPCRTAVPGRIRTESKEKVAGKATTTTAAMFPSCRACHRRLERECVAVGAEGQCGLWCPPCATCHNCRLPLEGEEGGAFPVLDELFCFRCPDAARLRAYDLSRAGAGIAALFPPPRNTTSVNLASCPRTNDPTSTTLSVYITPRANILNEPRPISVSVNDNSSLQIA